MSDALALIDAARIALGRMERDLACILECNCELDGNLQPILATLPGDVRGGVERLEADIADLKAAIDDADMLTRLQFVDAIGRGELSGFYDIEAAKACTEEYRFRLRGAA